MQPPSSEPRVHVCFISPTQGDQKEDLGAVIYLEDNLREHRWGARRGKGQRRKLIKDVIKLVTTAGNFHGAHTSGFHTQGERELGYLYTHSHQSCLKADAGGCLTSETEAMNTGEHRTRDARCF